MQTAKNRQSNIELLRILAAMGVIVLHYNNNQMGGAAFAATQDIPVNYFLLHALEAVFDSAVNLFVLISGYFLIQTDKRDLRKPMQLIFQVMVYDCIRYLFRVMSGALPFSVHSMIGAMIPDNYFVILYCTLFFISPYINRLVAGMTQKELQKFTLSVFLLFSVYPFFLDIFCEITGNVWGGLSPISGNGNLDGYSIVNFGMMYLLGAYTYRYGFSEISLKKLMVFELILIFGILVISYWSTKVAWEYCSPLVILSALNQFLIFQRLEIGSRKWINMLAKGSFSCYLLHTLFLPMLNIPYFAAKSCIVLLLHILGSCIAIYFISWITHLLYTAITDPLFRKLPARFFLFEP